MSRQSRQDTGVNKTADARRDNTPEGAKKQHDGEQGGGHGGGRSKEAHEPSSPASDRPDQRSGSESGGGN